MSIRVLFFASLADVVGVREAELEASKYPDVISIYSHFETAFPQLRIHRSSILFALNSEFTDPASAVKDGDEIAFLPPVSGG
jgi:molybdopterin converting factor subunit 1